MNKPKNNPKGGEDQARPSSKTPPSACEAKSLAPDVSSILSGISQINGAIEGVKGELATLAAKPDVDLSPISTFIGAVETGFSTLSGDIRALTEAQANAVSKSDIDQIKQMLAGIGFEMGGVKAGVSGLHGKVDVIGSDTSDIKAGVSRIESSVNELIDGMNAVIGDLHAMRESLDAIEEKVDGVNSAIEKVKEDTQYIPALSDDFGKFNKAFDGIIELLFSAIEAVPAKTADRMGRKLDAFKENLSKMAKDVSKANKGLQAILECGTELTENLNAAGQKVRGIANMAEAKVAGIAEEGAGLAREVIMSQLQGWIDPMIALVKDKLSDQEFIQMAGSVQKNIEILASSSKLIAQQAESLPDSVNGLLELINQLHEAKVFTYAQFVEITDNLKAAYGQISSHVAGIEKKTESVEKSVNALKTSTTDMVSQVAKECSIASANTLETRLKGMSKEVASDVSTEIDGKLRSIVAEVGGLSNIAGLDESITP